jgi:hypothetical protein
VTDDLIEDFQDFEYDYLHKSSGDDSDSEKSGTEFEQELKKDAKRKIKKDVRRIHLKKQKKLKKEIEKDDESQIHFKSGPNPFPVFGPCKCKNKNMIINMRELNGQRTILKNSEYVILAIKTQNVYSELHNII